MKQDNRILEGTIWKAILSFFFPILIGNFFQQLYNTVDAMIVGRFVGTVALSSVGGSSAIIINVVVGFFMGLSAGCTVLISQYFGAKDRETLEKSLHTTYAFGILGGILFGIAGVGLTSTVLRWMNTPQELMDSSKLYLWVYFSGLIFVFIYNLGAGILRALGDSKRPLYYLIICTFVNIALDIIFVVIFQMEVLGVALATLLSQGVSAILVTHALMYKMESCRLDLRKIRIDRPVFQKMVKIGLPSGIQSSTYSLSNVFIQSAINKFSVATIAAWTAEGKVDVIFWMINSSFGIAAVTFVGQNFGAKKMDRVRKGTRVCLMMSLCTAAVITVFLLTGGKYALMLFSKDAGVIQIAVHMMQLIVPAYFLFVFIEIFSAVLRAQGNTLVPTIINIVTIVVYRLVWIARFRNSGDLDMIIYCYPISWLLCAIFITIYFVIWTRKKKYV